MRARIETLCLLFLLSAAAAMAADNSHFQSYLIYKTPLEVGLNYTVGIGFMNTGDSAWTKAGEYELEIVEEIGSYCTGTLLSDDDALDNGQTKMFNLSCIPLPGDVGKTTIETRMMHDRISFGETGTLDFFEVENNCDSNAIDHICNKYCGAESQCHGYRQNDINTEGFCDSNCSFMDSPPAGWQTTTTITTTTKKKTTTTSTTTTTALTTTTTTTTTTLKCSASIGLREDGVCTDSCGASLACNGTTNRTAGCFNCGISTCGNGLVDAGELCDLSTGTQAWKCEAFVCQGSQSRGFLGCDNCNCSYYEGACVAGRCSAECDSDSGCNDFDTATDDSCNLSSCSCQHEPTQRFVKEEEAGKKATGLRTTFILIFAVLFLGAAAFTFARRKNRGKI